MSTEYRPIEWFPISTAPSGMRILIASATATKYLMPITVAVNHGGGWELAQCGALAEDNRPGFGPTHWMPLPAKPEAKR